MKSELIIVYPQVILKIRFDPKDLESEHTGNHRVIVVPKKFEWIT